MIAPLRRTVASIQFFGSVAKSEVEGLERIAD
jgi:hypothetical protein